MLALQRETERDRDRNEDTICAVKHLLPQGVAGTDGAPLLPWMIHYYD